MSDVHMKESVHIADPNTSAVTFLCEGSPVPDWARDLIPVEMLSSEPGALPVKTDKS